MCFVEFGSYDRPVDPHHYSEHINVELATLVRKKYGYIKKLFVLCLTGQPF